jgi:hypothetical protein
MYGTEFKVLACPVTGCMLVLELQHGKAGMSTAQYQDSLGATAACTVWLLEKSIPEDDDRIHTVQGDAWFGSVRAAAALGVKCHRVVLQVKNDKGLFPKDFIADALEDAPGGGGGPYSFEGPSSQWCWI